RLETALLGEPRLAEPVALVGLEIQSADVVEHQAGRAEPGGPGADRRRHSRCAYSGRRRLTVAYDARDTPASPRRITAAQNADQHQCGIMRATICGTCVRSGTSRNPGPW